MAPFSGTATTSTRPVRSKRAWDGFPPMVEKATILTRASSPLGDRAVKVPPFIVFRDGVFPS